MKLSKYTIGVLSNMASINPNIHIEPGNIIKTKTPRTVSAMAIAEVPETFHVAFSIYDLGNLLNTLKMFSDPDLVFNFGCIEITEGDMYIKYMYTDPLLIDSITNYDENVKLPEEFASFVLPSDTLDKLIKYSRLANTETLMIDIVNSDEVKLSTCNEGFNSDADYSNKMCVTLAPNEAIDIDGDGSVTKVSINIDNMKFTKGDYNVIIYKSAGNFCPIKFINSTTEHPMEYFVAANKL